MNQTKIKGGCQSGRKVVTQKSKRDLPLAICIALTITSGTMPDSSASSSKDVHTNTFLVRWRGAVAAAATVGRVMLLASMYVPNVPA